MKKCLLVVFLSVTLLSGCPRETREMEATAPRVAAPVPVPDEHYEGDTQAVTTLDTDDEDRQAGAECTASEEEKGRLGTFVSVGVLLVACVAFFPYLKRFSLVVEFCEFLMQTKKYWLLPILLILAFLAVLFVIAQTSPFGFIIYSGLG